MSFPDRLWLVGAGNMGGAMLRRWVESGVDPAGVTVIDPGAPAVPSGVKVIAEVPAEEAPDVVVLAIKPQQIDNAERAFGSMRGEPSLLISILAGIDHAALSRKFVAGTVFRAMPNLPVGIGKGVVALHSPIYDATAWATVETLMNPLGQLEVVDDEALFHAVTALSGSGPGFVYRFIAALADAGTALGLPRDQAQRLAIATVEGAAALAAASHETPAALADRVASPGGTTRAGLDLLDDGDAMKRLIAATLAAAARRSEEMAAGVR